MESELYLKIIYAGKSGCPKAFVRLDASLYGETLGRWSKTE
jgi:hypothetical protein